MTNFIPDNSANDIKKVVLWQYDNAYRLLTLLHVMKSYYDVTVKQFWDSWINDVLNIDTCNEYGAAIWGLVLGVERPRVVDSSSGEAVNRVVGIKMYRKILKAAFLFYKQNCSMKDITEYIKVLFTIEGTDHCGIKLVDNQDMSIVYEKSADYNNMDIDQQLVFEQLQEQFIPYPLGIRFNDQIGAVFFGCYTQMVASYGWYSPGKELSPSDLYYHYEEESSLGLYRPQKTITEGENTSWEAVKDKMTMLTKEEAQIHGSFAEKSAQPYETGVAYEKGETVFYDNRIYICKIKVTAGQNRSWESIKNSFYECFENVVLARTAMPFLGEE